jgi:hypothetical protein
LSEQSTGGLDFELIGAAWDCDCVVADRRKRKKLAGNEEEVGAALVLVDPWI